MAWGLDALDIVLLLPVVGGGAFCFACLWTTSRFFARRTPNSGYAPPVTVLKPIYGLDKGLEDSLKSICTQDYADYQVVLAVQRDQDPALPLLRRMSAMYPDRVNLVVKKSEPVVNGKVQNLTNALTAARHDLLVISDSDVSVAPDYLRTIVSPLADAEVGYVCSLYRSASAQSCYERLELLSMNADFVPSIIFSYMSGASDFCLGASVAFRRADLDAVGGMADLGEYLVEDYELGRRLIVQGKRFVLLPHIVDVLTDFPDFGNWWDHQVYWDQNTKAANPVGFFLTILTRSVPFALLLALLRGFDYVGLGILAATLAVRLGTAAAICHLHLADREGLRALWLLPVRDLAAVVSWCVAFTKRSFVWRGHRFGLTRQGRIVAREGLAYGRPDG